MVEVDPQGAACAALQRAVFHAMGSKTIQRNPAFPPVLTRYQLREMERCRYGLTSWHAAMNHNVSRIPPICAANASRTWALFASRPDVLCKPLGLDPWRSPRAERARCALYTPWAGLWHTPSVPCSRQRPA